jgi:hypothetical protein
LTLEAASYEGQMAGLSAAITLTLGVSSARRRAP